MKLFFSTLSLLLLLTFSACSQQTINDPQQAQQLDRVIDGDTFVMKNGDTIRVQAIDTPESKKPNTSIEAFSFEAFTRTKSLLENNIFILQEKSERTEDKYDRLLRSVYFPRIQKYLAEILVFEGLAKVYYDDTIEAAFLKKLCTLERQAKQSGKKIWDEENKEYFEKKRNSCPVS